MERGGLTPEAALQPLHTSHDMTAPTCAHMDAQRTEGGKRGASRNDYAYCLTRQGDGVGMTAAWPPCPGPGTPLLSNVS